MSRLNDLLRQLEAKDPALAKDLRQEYDALADRRAFGLNFERHTPEVVELPGRKIRKGDKVHILAERGKSPSQENSRIWRVVAIDRAHTTPVATLEVPDMHVEPGGAAPAPTLETRDVAVGDLVVAAEFRDPIYPGLVSTGKVGRGGDKPFHSVINAENYHALQTLLFTRRGKVDCIYIDPPYNTGNDGWIYNDKYVAGDDHYKHSKWLAFMERRLILAKELLKPTGVIIVAIGDDEHHRLRMLMDAIFDSGNFLANLVWQGGRKGSRYVSASQDYMLVFARDKVTLDSEVEPWKERKPGVDRVLEQAQQIFAEADFDHAAATKQFRAWLRTLNKSEIPPAVTRYSTLEPVTGRPFRPDGDAGAPDSPETRCHLALMHPITGLPCPVPPKGWRWNEQELLRRVDDGSLVFGKDHTTTPSVKRYLDALDTQTPSAVFERDRTASSNALSSILGEVRFPYPKDVDVLARWIGIVAPPDAVVVDFFAGSGSTVSAVMQLNESDEGSRECIVITNNEVPAAAAKNLIGANHRHGDPEWEALGVYEHVTRPRVETVVSGVRPDGSTYSRGLNQNVEFFTLTYEAPLRVSSDREFSKIGPLLWMRAGSRGRRIDDMSAGWEVADTYGVLADLDHTADFLKAVAAAGDDVAVAFVVTDEDRLFQSVARELPGHVEAVRLYEAYLRNFEIESGRSML